MPFAMSFKLWKLLALEGGFVGFFFFFFGHSVARIPLAVIINVLCYTDCQGP